MGTTPIKSLTTLEAGQASPHIPVNELMYFVDTMLNVVIADKDLATPPSSPSSGDTYFVAASPTGDWASQAGKIVTYRNSAWEFTSPSEGTLVYVTDESQIYVYQSNSLVSLAAVAGALQNLSLLGVNTTADATNKLAVSSGASLFNHDGNGHQQKINKNAEADTASVVFQNDFSGRAEFGLIGDDDFSLKVSDDGSTFNDALKFDNSNGAGRFPQGQFNGIETVADDTVATVTVPTAMRKSGIFMFHVQDPSSDFPKIEYSGAFIFDAGGSATAVELGKGANTDIVSTTLAGTTGTDGNASVGPNTSNQIQIENRTGTSRDFRYVFMG